MRAFMSCDIEIEYLNARYYTFEVIYQVTLKVSALKPFQHLWLVSYWRVCQRAKFLLFLQV
jgi:hypothetical protein